MQCTSFTPVYYHARDLNLGANGYSWHRRDSNASYGEERGYNFSISPCDQLSGYDKEMLKQIIQNHEATFRHQVQELHRLYRRQRDLMDETRMREIFAHHLLSRKSEPIHSFSHSGEFSQNRAPATNWLFSNLAAGKLSELMSGDVLGPKTLVAENLKEPPTLQIDSFSRKNSISNVQFLLPSYKQNGNGIASLELPTDMHHDDQGKQFKDGNLSEAHLKRRTPEEISNFQPANDSDFTSIRTWERNCFIDLNEPMQLESLPTSSPGPLEAFTSHNKTVCSESIILTESQLLKSDDGNSDGINSSMAIDLNSMPVNYFSETEMTPESPTSMSREAKVVLDCSPDCNHAMSNKKCSEQEPVAPNNIGDSFLKTEIYIDLNTGVVDGHSLPLPQLSSTPQIKSADDTELKGPMSPENEESSPPRGKSEDIQLETPLSSEGEGEPFITIAAETLAIMGSAVLYPQASFRNLCWFAEFVSSTGDDIENKVLKHENYENALNISHLNKTKGKCTMSRRSRKGQKRGMKRCQTEEALGSRDCLKTGQVKRKAGKNGCAKPIKCPKLSPSDVTKKSMSLILKQSTARMEQGVLQSWGEIRKRQGGRRRRSSHSFTLAELASF